MPAVAAPPELFKLDLIQRRVMFALELVDPVTGLLVSDDLRITTNGYGAPGRSPSGRFVWPDIDPPEARTVKLKVISQRGVFAPLETDIQTTKYRENIPPAELTRRFVLQATGLYDPPPGLLAVGGMLIDDKVTRQPVPGVTAQLRLRAADGSVFATAYQPATDARGLFMAVVTDLGGRDLLPTPPPQVGQPPAPEGGVVGWVAFTSGGATKHSDLLPLRQGRLLRAIAPFEWTALNAAEPPPP